MLRLLHAADFHLDSPFSGLTTAQSAQRRRELRQLPARLAELDGICDDFYVLGGGVVRGRYEHYEFARAVREAAASGIAEK